VGLALDHVVANMFIVPMGDLEWGAVGVGYYTWKSLILRNMIGGGFFCGRCLLVFVSQRGGGCWREF